MTIQYGVTATGFVKKTLDVIKVEFEDAYRAAFGQSINVRPPSLMATAIGIAAEREAKIWDMGEEAFNSRSSSSAQGVALDNANELVNVLRLKATPSVALTQYFFGTPGTVITSSFIASVVGNTAAKFSPNASLTLIAGTNAVQKLSFSAVPDAGTWKITLPDGQQTASLAFNANATAVQTAIRLLTGWDGLTVSGDYTAGFTVTFVDGATVGSAGHQPQAPLGATSLVTNGGGAVMITQSETTAGVAQGSATMIALLTGPTVATTGTLTTIETPISGLTATKNAADAVPGRNVETDSAYRIRKNEELQNAGATTVEAIRDAIKKVSGVKTAIVYQNKDDTTDGSGRPPHSVQAYVDGGANQDIGDKLWLEVGGGIQTYGEVSVNVTDSQGITQILNFSRPVDKNAYVIVNVTKDSLVFPATGSDQIKAAIMAYAAGLAIGDDVLVYPKLLPAIADAVVGITNLGIKVGFAPVPTLDSNLVIAASERAVFDTSRITVNVS